MRHSLTLGEVREGDRIGTPRGWAEVITPPRQNKHNRKDAGVPHVGFTVRYDDRSGSTISGPPSLEVEVVREEL